MELIRKIDELKRMEADVRRLTAEIQEDATAEYKKYLGQHVVIERSKGWNMGVLQSLRAEFRSVKDKYVLRIFAEVVNGKNSKYVEFTNIRVPSETEKKETALHEKINAKSN